MIPVARYTEALVWRASNRGASRLYHELLDDMHADRATLDRLVDERLHRLLSYAVHEVPFYRRDELKRAVATRSPREALESFPVLAKTDLRRSEEQLRGSDMRGAKPNHSGGSTGHILDFVQSPAHWVHAAAGRRLGAVLCGWRPGDSIVSFFGMPAADGLHNLKWVRPLREALSSVYVMDAYAPDDRMLRTVAARLARRPAVLIGFASTIGHLARYLRERDRRIQAIAIQTSADTLSDSLRHLIQDTFQAPVFNRYGSRESSIIAHEWHDHEGLYVFERNNFVEVLDTDGLPAPPGVPGRIVITNLNNRAMPFIRYDIGDVGSWYKGSAPAASSLKRLGTILGRENDLIYSPSGAAVHSKMLARVFYSIPGVNQFQVIQNDRRHLIIRLLTVSNVDHGSLVTKVRESVRRIDAAFEIDFEFPRDIPVLPSGKRRYVYRTWESSTPNHIDEVAGLRSRKTPLNEGLERSTVMSFARYAEPLMWRASNRGAHRVLRALLNDMTADRAVLDRMVDERLHRLLSYAVHDVPFYGRDDLRRAVRTQSPRGALESFPVLAKTDVGRLEAQLRGSDLRGANTNHSGGSTGHILNFLQSPEHRTHAAAGRRATAMLCGWRPGMPVVTFFGNPAVVGQHRRRPGALLKDRLSRFYLLDAFAPDEATLHAVAARLARQPALLIGYASLLGHLARYLIERNQRIKTVAVQSTADTLPETLRQMLEQVFQAPVYNRYGSRELSIIGHEGHDQDGLYVFERNNLVEILDAAGRPCPLGVAGRIVVTNLNNRAMPFIRYEIGDVGYWHDDGPGVSNLKRLGAVLGRENDLILGPSGKAVYCEFFARLFYAAPGVKQFQVVQDGRTHLKIQIVADDTVDEQSLAAYLTDSIRRVADPEFEIDFEFPDDIATLPSGKRRYVYRTWQADMVDGVTQ